MAVSSENFIEELIKTKAETYGSESGTTSVPKVVEINTKVENAIKSMDGLDPDKPSGEERSGSKDENGHNKNSYGFCSECGKPLEKPTKDNLCSAACQLKHNSKNIMEDVKSAQDKAEDVQGKMGNLANSTSALMGILSQMTSLLAEVESAGLDPKYTDYFKVKINTVIQYVKLQIQFALISKNQKQLDQLQKSKNGMDTSASGLNVLANVDKAVEAAQKLLEQFQKMYDQIYKVLCSIKPLVLDAESLNFQMTPRSMLKHPGNLVNILPNNNINQSCGQVLFAEQIVSTVKAAFPPIQEVEYLMPPAAFNARKAFSDQNQKAIMSLINILMFLLKGPTEPLPKYEDLKITNIHYLLFLLTSWGPEGLNHYAMPLYPP